VLKAMRSSSGGLEAGAHRFSSGKVIKNPCAPNAHGSREAQRFLARDDGGEAGRHGREARVILPEDENAGASGLRSHRGPASRC